MTAAVAAHLWQSSLCVGLAALLAFALRRHAAAVRYGVWCAASVKFLVPFALLAAAWDAVGLRAPVRAPDMLVIFAQGLAAPVPSTPDSLTLVLAVLWACGAMAMLMRHLRQVTRMNSALRAARPLPVPAPIPVVAASWRLEPGLAGIVRPVLVLPEGIDRRLTPEELRAVVAHELCHWRRRDNLTAAVHMLTEALFWFHPFVWWLGARLVEERERACDEDVIAAGGDAETYAEGILKVCKLYTASTLACAPGVSGGGLKRRIEEIMADRRIIPLGRGSKVMLGLAAGVLILAPLAAVWLGFTDVMRAPRGGRDATGRIIAPRADPAHPNVGAGEFYPAESRALGEEGSLVLQLTVTDTGAVSKAVMESGSGHTRLDDAARHAAASWRFLPGTVDGAPRAMRMPIRVTFRLPPDAPR